MRALSVLRGKFEDEYAMRVAPRIIVFIRPETVSCCFGTFLRLPVKDRHMPKPFRKQQKPERRMQNGIFKRNRKKRNDGMESTV